jgi:hypothetical protein
MKRLESLYLKRPIKIGLYFYIFKYLIRHYPIT